MGRGIAQTYVRGGCQVTLVDRSPEDAERSWKLLLAEVEQAEASGLMPEGSSLNVRSRTTWASGIATAVVDADLVVEAVIEDTAVKQAVLRQIEAAARPDTVIASNTSAIRITTLAEALSRPERFFGVHWFNPAQLVPGAEIVLGERSDEQLLYPVIETLRRCGKEPVVVQDTPGFVANRLQFALFIEAARMVEEGVASPDEIDAVMRATVGFRTPFFGPFAIADMAGLDVYALAISVLERDLGPRFSVPSVLTEKVAAGMLGAKTGEGFLSATSEEWSRMISVRDRSYAALAQLRRELGDSRD